MKDLRFVVLDVTVTVICEDDVATSLLVKKFGGMRGIGQGPELCYRIRRNSRREFEIEGGNELIVATSEGDLLFYFEEAMVVEVEKCRKDLYFLHAASLLYRNQGCLLVAESGSGKSTTAWALIHEGFDFLSDELSPVDLEALEVYPFSQALCLKTKPPSPYQVIDGFFQRDSRLHIPLEFLPCKTVKHPVPLKYLFFLMRYSPGCEEPHAREVTPAEATARLYSNTLNALAHDHMGLDAAIRIGSSCRSYEIRTAELKRTTFLLKGLVEG